MAHIIEPDPDAVVVRVEPDVAQSEEIHNRGPIEQHERVVRDATGAEHRERVVRDVAGERLYVLAKVTQVTWVVVAIIEAAIGLRVLLKLIGANPENEFAHFTHSFAAVFLAPFFGLTGSPAAGGVVLEVPSIIAMLVYALFGWGLIRVIWLFFSQPLTRTSTTYDRYVG